MATRPHCLFDVVIPFVNSSKRARIPGEFCGPEHITGGAAVGDYNRDGIEDIFFSVFHGRSVLYRNNGETKFGLSYCLSDMIVRLRMVPKRIVVVDAD